MLWYSHVGVVMKHTKSLQAFTFSTVLFCLVSGIKRAKFFM